MILDSFIYSCYKKSEEFKSKHNIAERLTEIVFECDRLDIDKDDERIFIYVQFQVPGLWKVRHPPGPMCYGINDQQTAELLDLSYNDFKNKMINEFNAYLKETYAGSRLYFYNQEDALNAFEWMRSIVLSYELQKK